VIERITYNDLVVLLTIELIYSQNITLLEYLFYFSGTDNM